MTSQPLHGGDIVAASRLYGTDESEWIDLSTGINPRGYPVAPLAPEVFQQLPYPSAELQRCAAAYYGNASLLPVAGTQAAIQALPQCLSQLTSTNAILLPAVGYQEHRKHWLKSGIECVDYPSLQLEPTTTFIDQQLQQNPNQHLLIINPNNPTGLCFSPQQLLLWSQQLAPGTCLIVDEAFMDVSPEMSLLQTGASLPDNVIVLRSCGKFFGLAGIRLGFVFASEAIRSQLQELLGLWMISGPTQAVAIQALKDETWQQQARVALHRCSAVTRELFEPLVNQFESRVNQFESRVNQFEHSQVSHHALFSSYRIDTSTASWIQDYFARQAILLRVIPVNDDDSILRIGSIDAGHKGLCGRIESAVTGAVADLNQVSCRLN
jgi:cobalamin biosynthesis protein CobC